MAWRTAVEVGVRRVASRGSSTIAVQISVSVAAVPVAVFDVLKGRRKDERICFVGTSSNPKSHHHVLVKNFARNGYRVAPVSPTVWMIEALQRFRSVQGLMEGETRRGRLCVL